MRARVAAAVFGAWLALLAVAFCFSPEVARLPIRLAAAASAIVVIRMGVARNRPYEKLPWILLIAAVALSGLGAAAYDAPSLVPDVVRTVAGPVLLVAVYPFAGAALLIFIRRRTGGTRDRAGLLDALTVTSALALISWTFLLAPRVHDGRLFGLILAIGGLACLGLLTRLLTAAGQKLICAYVLGAGLLLTVFADIAFDLTFLDLGRIVLYAAVGIAALDETMAELSRPGPPADAELSRPRLALIGVASMVAPAVLLAKMFLADQVTDLAVVAVLSAVTFLLVLVRMAGIMANHRLALSRERGLREASAALVSATDVDEVGNAVRTAVAHLLPADVPHGVVLGLAITQADEPQSPEAIEQAAFDRAAGTVARLVATRDVDWAVAIRLTQFNMTLRCPMVLPDRPGGNPLVGVLHVGAPAWSMPGLQRAIEVLAGQAALAIERVELSQEVTRRNSETYFRTLIRNTSDLILIVDDRDRIRYASPSALTVLGGDPTGVRLYDVIDIGDRDRLAGVIAAARGGAGVQEGLDLRAVGLHPGEILLAMHCRDLRADPTVRGIVLTLRDVTERRRLERELSHRAFHDGMTGLANRVLFADRLQHALARGARDGSIVGILYIDLDDFKIVNDTLGHAAGDQLLIHVAKQIAGALRADDTPARLGGDEFAALIENVWDPIAVEETAQRILTALSKPVVIDDQTTLTAVASIGITTTPEGGSPDELQRQADLALYVAKGAGKNQWRRYQSHLHGAMVERLELRSALDHAVNEGHFLLAYQPIVDLSTDEPVGFEALVRWHHPTKGVVAPVEFIEVAEESGLIVPMGRWVLDEALHTVAQWRRILPRTRQPYVSVNVSVRQFREAGFVDQIMHSLSYAGVPPQALMIELTESLLVRENETVWQDLAVLHENGVRIAIDDFGTGYSSLAYLRQRQIDVVKIDKTFIDDMTESPQQLALVSGIVSLAQSLGLTVVAEGIESAAHRDLLARLGCPLGQGYYYSAPVDGTEAIGQLTRTQPIAA